ncbi:hypothetical protein BDZ45DRAFT_184971 [Acephala macrosclerotiorum]|nr:hypothetical protein BDZ45DRAFT_184971 [Acephala macrosclerotiorum]
MTVPGVGTPPLASWSNGDGGIWLTSIPPTSAPDIAVYYFEHDFRADEDFSWKVPFDRGADLLDELINLGDAGELSDCPIILIANSLGGIIVKEAMSLIHQQATNFRRLWRTVTGALFLGTPHSQSNDPSSRQNASAVLRLHSGSEGAKILMTPDVARGLLRVSLSFEQAFDLIPSSPPMSCVRREWEASCPLKL